jgi:hypothetical protein
MKTFKKECRHAQLTREHKGLYTEAEREGGCWECGGPLTQADIPPEWQTPDPLYECAACTQRKLEKSRAQARGAGRTRTLKEMIADGNARRAELVREVEECGPDCPFWERLEVWKK